MTLVGENLHPGLKSLLSERAAEGRFTHLAEAYETKMLEGKKIIFIADQDTDLEARVYQEASEKSPLLRTRVSDLDS